MKTLNYTNATTFSSTQILVTALFALLFVSFLQPLNASGYAAPGTHEQKSGSSLVLQLDQQMSGYQIIAVENLISDEDGFEGAWWSATPSQDLMSVNFAHVSGPRTLPADREVALVTVQDPEAGFTRQFLLGTDGGAVLIILGDF